MIDTYLPRLKVKALGGSSNLWHMGVPYAVVTHDTEELVAAFACKADAEGFLDYMKGLHAKDHEQADDYGPDPDQQVC